MLKIEHRLCDIIYVQKQFWLSRDQNIAIFPVSIVDDFATIRCLRGLWVYNIGIAGEIALSFSWSGRVDNGQIRINGKKKWRLKPSLSTASKFF